MTPLWYINEENSDQRYKSRRQPCSIIWWASSSVNHSQHRVTHTNGLPLHAWRRRWLAGHTSQQESSFQSQQRPEAEGRERLLGSVPPWQLLEADQAQDRTFLFYFSLFSQKWFFHPNARTRLRASEKPVTGSQDMWYAFGDITHRCTRQV
jgi:hypothetical protein